MLVPFCNNPSDINDLDDMNHHMWLVLLSVLLETELLQNYILVVKLWLEIQMIEKKQNKKKCSEILQWQQK